jgi:hypothetical protein
MREHSTSEVGIYKVEVMKKKIMFLACMIIYVVVLSLAAQDTAKLGISAIRELPSEPPIKTAICSSSTSGYLEKNGTVLTEAEIGTTVSKALKEGYVVTLFPESKRGIFVNFECPHPASAKPMVP